MKIVALSTAPLPSHTNPPSPGHTQLGTALADLGVIDFTAPPTLDELRKYSLAACGASIRGGISSTQYASDDEGDLSD